MVHFPYHLVLVLILVVFLLRAVLHLVIADPHHQFRRDSPRSRPIFLPLLSSSGKIQVHHDVLPTTQPQRLRTTPRRYQRRSLSQLPERICAKTAIRSAQRRHFHRAAAASSRPQQV